MKLSLFILFSLLFLLVSSSVCDDVVSKSKTIDITDYKICSVNDIGNNYSQMGSPSKSWNY